MIKNSIESFFWGIIAALGALIIELVVFIFFSSSSNQTANISFLQFFIAPQFIITGVLIEEIFKYIVISKCVEKFSLQRSYITNSLFVGLGFFSVEVGLILTTSTLVGINLLAELAIIHIGTAGIIGYIVAIKNPKKVTTFISAIILAVFFHGAYNFLIINRDFILNYIIFALLAIIIFVNFVNLIKINNKLAQD